LREKRSSAKGGCLNERLADPPCPQRPLLETAEMYFRQLWELQHIVYSLGYVDDLADEAEIAAAVEVARGDYPQWGRAA
jgi:hypothetical protein